MEERREGGGIKIKRTAEEENNDGDWKNLEKE